MSRTRSIKPGFFKNEDLCSLSPLTRILFAGLWTLADRAGRLEDRPARVRAELFPYEQRISISKMLDALQSIGLIQRYASNGARYIAITAWEKHQHPHNKEPLSEIPAPVSTRAEPGTEPGEPGCDPEPVPEKPVPIRLLSLICNPLTNICASDDALVNAQPDLPAPEPPQPKRKPGHLTEQQKPWFDAWWATYWLKKDRARAEEHFARAVTAPELFERVMAATREQLPEMLNREPDKRPYAKTWLYGKRWEDEPLRGSTPPPSSRPPQQFILSGDGF